MFRNNLKIAWRSLLKDRQSTLLNLIGLSTGLTCALLIYLWVTDELSFDRWHGRDTQLYQLMERRVFFGEESITEESSGLLAATVAKEMPEVTYAATVIPSAWFPKFTLSTEEKTIKAAGQYVGTEYFDIFPFPLLAGNKDQVLADKHSIAISEDLARELFNSVANAIGKSLRLEHDKVFRVSGVFQRLPVHSTEKFDFLMSFEYYRDIMTWVKEWGNTGPHNYILVKKGTDITAFNKKLAGIVTRNSGDSLRKVFAFPYSDTYLYSSVGPVGKTGGRIEYVRLFSLIAVFILVIACINFMNLSTAKAARRLKEVGIKKVVGAGRRQLVYQFLSESMLLAVIAMIFAFLLTALFMPAFNHLTGKQLSLHIDLRLLTAVLTIILITGVLSGSYPAFYLSGFNPIAVLKGKLSSSLGEVFIRKGLVVLQFTLSMIFIVAVAVVYRQMRYIQTKNLGYNKDHVIVFNSEGKLYGNQETFIAGLKRLPGVVDATGTSHGLTGHNFATGGLNWEGMDRDPKKNPFFEVASVGYDFIHTMGISIKAGRGFSRDYKDEGTKIILNEASAKLMGFKDPVGRSISMWGNKWQIIGVIRDFHFESLHEEVKPMLLNLRTSDSNYSYRIMARIQAGRESEVIARIRAFYQSFNPGFVFDYHFLDEAFQFQYESEKRVEALSKYFAVLAILISCLGLFGLAAFTAQRRQKEIGIRKVVGASAGQIALMLSVGFLRLVGLAILIAFPLAWWIMGRWLHSFAYRVDLSPGIFVLAGASVIFIALLTVSFQSVRAAMASPVRNLKAE
ncbi:MAG TPA: ABC transporter permease [Puia sp.]|nr:ABC transporter permease [Puia sp.]